MPHLPDETNTLSVFPEGLDGAADSMGAQTPGEAVSGPRDPALTVVPLDALKRLLGAVMDDPERSTPYVAREAEAFLLTCMQLGHERDALTDVSRLLGELIEVQTRPGNYDFSPYMLGLANGLLMTQGLLYHRAPELMTSPAVWGEDRSVVDDDDQGPRPWDFPDAKAWMAG